MYKMDNKKVEKKELEKEKWLVINLKKLKIIIMIKINNIKI